MSIQVLAPVQERGTRMLTVSWFDEDGSPVVPDSASWSLVNRKGSVINGRSAVAISSPATQNTIVLSGADLDAPSGDTMREVLFTYTYTSATYGSVTDTKGVRFTIEDLWGA